MKATFLNKVAEVKRGMNGLAVNINREGYSTYRMASGANLARVLQQIGSDVDFMMITNYRAYEADPDENGQKIPRPKAKNEKDFCKMPNILRDRLSMMEIGAYWLVGHWATCTVPLKGAPMNQCQALGGEIEDSLEYSWLFTKPRDGVSSKEWLANAITFATEYLQDGFVIRLDGETTLRTSNGTIDKKLTTNGAVQEAWAALAKLRSEPTEYGFGYSELRKVRERGRLQPIVFQDEPGAAPVAKESGYHVVGTGKPHEIDFFLAEPHSNSSKQMFASLGVYANGPEGLAALTR